MTTIEPNAPYSTVINVFIVEPQHIKQLADALAQATEKHIRHQAGFISANIHISTDGTRVVNYSQWRSPEDLKAMLEDLEVQEHIVEAAAIASSSEPHLYIVDSVHHS